MAETSIRILSKINISAQLEEQSEPSAKSKNLILILTVECYICYKTSMNHGWNKNAYKQQCHNLNLLFLFDIMYRRSVIHFRIP